MHLKTKLASAFLLSSVLSLGLLAGCQAPKPNNGTDNINTSTITLEEADNLNVGNINFDNIDLSPVKMIGEYSLDDLIENSNIIVTAKIDAFSSSFMIEPVDGSDPAFFTDVFASLLNTYKGDPILNDNNQLIIRDKGGSGLYSSSFYPNAPDLQEGETYLLFLYKVADGSNYNTEGNQYYIYGQAEGVWKIEFSEEDSESIQFVNSMTEETVSSTELKEKIASLDNGEEQGIVSVDTDIAELEEKHNAGTISDDAYQEQLQKLNAAKEQYSRILSDEEQRAYEEESLNNMMANINEEDMQVATPVDRESISTDVVPVE